MKIEGQYETVMRAAALYRIDQRALYEQIVLSCLVGNGDAHLKNFAILYSGLGAKPSRGFGLDPRLSSVYDVVCTRFYDDNTLALRLAGVREFPNRNTLIAFGEKAGIRRGEALLPISHPLHRPVM